MEPDKTDSIHHFLKTHVKYTLYTLRQQGCSCLCYFSIEPICKWKLYHSAYYILKLHDICFAWSLVLDLQWGLTYAHGKDEYEHTIKSEVLGHLFSVITRSVLAFENK